MALVGGSQGPPRPEPRRSRSAAARSSVRSARPTSRWHDQRMVSPPGSGPPRAIRVFTMNLYGPGNPDWQRRHQLVGQTVLALDPDVIALQEVPVDSADTLARLL